jgi:hypothetical protein
MAKKTKTLQPYRVSFYFKDEVVDGKAPLAGMTVFALNAEDAIIQVFKDSQDPKTGESPLVVVKAYRSSRPYRVPTRQTYIKVAPPTTFVGTTVNTAQSSTVDVIFPDPSTILGPLSSSSGTYNLPAVIPPKTLYDYNGSCSPDCTLCAEGRAAADKAIGKIVEQAYVVGPGDKFGSFGSSQPGVFAWYRPWLYVSIIMVLALGYLAVSYGGVSYLKHLSSPSSEYSLPGGNK